jgi:hypothetical protein
MPAALAVDWDTIKQAAIAGVPVPDLARQWGMIDPKTGRPDTTAIRKRSSREQWPIPRAVMDRAQKMMAEARKNVKQLVTKPIVTVSQDPQNPLHVVAESTVTYGKRAQLAILAGLVPEIETAMQQPGKFRPENIKELVMVGSLAHKLAGMDKDSQEIKVNVAMFGHEGAIQQEAETWDCQPETIPAGHET